MVPAARFPPGGQRARRIGNRCSASVRREVPHGGRVQECGPVDTGHHRRFLGASQRTGRHPRDDKPRQPGIENSPHRHSRWSSSFYAAGRRIAASQVGESNSRDRRAKAGFKTLPGQKQFSSSLGGWRDEGSIPIARSGFFRIHLAAGANSYLTRGCGTKSCSAFNAPASMNKR